MLYPVLQEFLSAVAERENVDPETGEMTNYENPDILQNIAELKLSVEEEVLAAAGYIKSKDAEIEILSERIAQLSDLKKRMTRKNELIKQRMITAMEAAKIDRVDSLELSVRIQSFGSLEVDEGFENKLPKALLRVIIEPDKTAIKKEIKSGEAFACARMVYKDSPVIRVK